MLIRVFAIFAVIAVAVAGCSKLTAGHYKQVKAGMDYNQVNEILGNPDECSEIHGTKQCLWGDDSKNIQITFVANKATLTTQTNIQ